MSHPEDARNSGPAGHINQRIVHSVSEAQDKKDSRNHGE